MAKFVVLLAVVVEITVLIVVGKALGVLPTILLLVVISMIGMALLRREGAHTLAAFVESVRTRRLPHREVADGVLITAAGALILIPGFVSDLLALALLFPPTRAVVRRRILRRAVQRGRERGAGGAFVVDSEVADSDGFDSSHDDVADKRATSAPVALPRTGEIDVPAEKNQR
jgi:UPF0716 protein FxsA